MPLAVYIFGGLWLATIIKLAIDKPRIPTMGSFTTIRDFIAAAKKLGVKWLGTYLSVGCPYGEKGRGAGYAWFFGRNKAISDLLCKFGVFSAFIGALFGLSPLFRAIIGVFGWEIDPFWMHGLGIGWWAPLMFLADGLLTVICFYGPLNGVGEFYHGDPFAQASDSNVGDCAGRLYVPDGYQSSAKSYKESRARQAEQKAEHATEKASKVRQQAEAIPAKALAVMRLLAQNRLTGLDIRGHLGIKAGRLKRVARVLVQRQFVEQYPDGFWGLTEKGKEALEAEDAH